ncbi:MAG: hypothetical protein IJR45_02985, partial [Firmicutes bacterium]|nr:hypothetical protein [Bacillota bacterium]
NRIIDSSHIEAQGVSGCFGTAPSLSSCKILSSGSGALEYKMTFKDVVYTGTGSNFGFKIRYKGIETSNQINLKINECSPSNGSSGDIVTDTDDSGNTVVKILAPSAEIKRAPLNPVKGGETFEVELTVKNRGAAEMLDPVLSVTTSADISLVSNTSSLFIPDIKPSGSTKIKLKFKAEDTLTSSSEDINTVLSFRYKSGADVETGESSAVITIPTVANRAAETAAVQLIKGDSPAVAPDTEFTLPVTVKNVGETDIKNIVLSFTSDSGIIITDNSLTKLISEIKAGDSAAVSLKCRTEDILSDTYQYITCDMKYNYISRKETMSGDESAKFAVRLIPNSKESASPLIQLAHSDISGPINAKESFSFKINVKNAGTTDIVNAVLDIEGSDEIMITGGTSSFSFNSLKAGESKTFTVKAKAAGELNSASQKISAELKYNYKSGKNYENGSASTGIIVPCVKKDDETDKTAKPNVIIERFNYGNQSVATGEQFDLSVSFRNMGSVPVENLVMTLEPDAGLAISSATNTYFFDSLGANQSNAATVEMYALPTADSGSAKVELTFKYEYMDNKTRTESTSSQTISVPLYTPDLMTFTAPEMNTPGVVGEEYTFSVEYVNKGKGEIANVRAEIIGDISTVQKAQNIGNIEKGKSGKINFLVTPDMAGENPFTVKITYEDANMKEKERIFNLSVNAEEAMFDEDMDWDTEPEEPQTKSPLKTIGIVIGIIAAIAVIIAVIKKIRKNKNNIKMNWED